MNQRAGGTSSDSVSVTVTKSIHWADNGPFSGSRLLLQQHALFGVHGVCEWECHIRADIHSLWDEVQTSHIMVKP